MQRNTQKKIINKKVADEEKKKLSKDKKKNGKWKNYEIFKPKKNNRRKREKVEVKQRWKRISFNVGCRFFLANNAFTNGGSTSFQDFSHSFLRNKRTFSLC